MLGGSPMEVPAMAAIVLRRISCTQPGSAAPAVRHTGLQLSQNVGDVERLLEQPTQWLALKE